MISVQDAKQIIQEHASSLKPTSLALKDTNGLTLAENIYAQTDIPAFIQSSVDGYAFIHGTEGSPLLITGEAAAGAAWLQEINKGEATRIFTGAPLPAGADTVVMQEFCIVADGKVTINHKGLLRGEHVRLKGSEIQAGALAMEMGERIVPAAIGFLAGIGIETIMVYPAPAVTLIVTGRELRPAGSVLEYGQVYDSSSVMIAAALQSAGVHNVKMMFADDTLEEVTNSLNIALQDSDIVMLTGGISVGDYDFVLQATKNCGVNQHFHKVKQKPGKPLYFGTYDRKLVFGLPGNPSSSLTCFYEYILPALDIMLQRPSSIVTESGILQQDYTKKQGLTHLLKGTIENGKVSLLNAQESYRLASYAKANCLIIFPEQEEQFKAGSNIMVHLL